MISTTIEDQLHAAMDAEYRLVPPGCGVLDLAARLSANMLVHDTATAWAMADGRIRPSVIHVVARIELPGSSAHAGRRFRSFRRRQPASRPSASQRFSKLNGHERFVLAR
jgi:hypothetical protein